LENQGEGRLARLVPVVDGIPVAAVSHGDRGGGWRLVPLQAWTVMSPAVTARLSKGVPSPPRLPRRPTGCHHRFVGEFSGDVLAIRLGQDHRRQELAVPGGRDAFPRAMGLSASAESGQDSFLRPVQECTMCKGVLPCWSIAPFGLRPGGSPCGKTAWRTPKAELAIIHDRDEPIPQTSLVSGKFCSLVC
jgi:hypothetical protein